jgi:hypothetical protein
MKPINGCSSSMVAGQRCCAGRSVVEQVQVSRTEPLEPLAPDDHLTVTVPEWRRAAERQDRGASVSGPAPCAV